MGVTTATLAKVAVALGVTGTAVAIPFSLPKLTGASPTHKPENQEVTVQVNSEVFDRSSGITSDGPPQRNKYLPENCRAIASYSSSTELKELLLCLSTSSPVFYFYESKRPEIGVLNTKVQAQKVKTVSSKQGYDIYLSITLDNGEVKNIHPTFVTRWADIENLVPEKDCKITSETGNAKKKLSCKQSKRNQEFIDIDSWEN